MKRNNFRIAMLGIGLSLGLATFPAFATTRDIPDAAEDALVVSDSGVAYGDFDIDLRNVRVDHGTKSVLVTAKFSYTNVNSWTDLMLQFDTDLDGYPDYQALWSLSEGVSGVLEVDDSGSPTGNVTCTSIGTSQKLGVNGSVALSIPRTCLGNPTSVAVHLDVFWFGTSQAGTDLTFVDSAPGEFIDDPISFSSPIASSNTGTSTSPKPPVPAKVKTKVAASLSKTTQTIGRAPAKLKVRVVGSGGPAGKVKITDGSKLLKTIAIRPNKAVSYQLPKKLKVGVHRIKVSFTPTSKARFTTSTKTLRLKVRR